MPVTLPADVLIRYRRVTLYNSPYVAHDHGRAVDLYPGDATGPDPLDGPPVDAPSPVAGEILATRTVTAPSQSYAAERDHLILVDTGVGDGPSFANEGDERGTVDAPVARIMHVDPAVEAGDRVAVGDSLGTLVRAGFFAPWVANHVHLGFRPPDADPYRASGSLPLELDSALPVEPLAWDGAGTVVAAGDTYAVLDSPTHPAPGERFAGLAVELVDGEGRDGARGVLDGGFPHYGGGGVLAGDDATVSDGAVRLLGTTIGTRSGRDVAWADVTVLANGEPVGGLALSLAREVAGAKLVGEDVGLAVGESVQVTVRRDDSDTSSGLQ